MNTTKGNRVRCLAASLAMTLTLMVSAASGQLVTADNCKPRCCSCDDTSFIKSLLSNTSQALAVYQNVMNDPRMNNPRWVPQDEAANQLKQITPDANIQTFIDSCGTTLGMAQYATVVLNQCYCDNTCEVAPNSTLLHERTHITDHAKTLLKYGLGGIPALFIFSPGREAIASEINAHQKQIDYLNRRMGEIRTDCAANSSGNGGYVDPSCISNAAIGANWSSRPPSDIAQAGLFKRVSLLASRIVYGAQ